MMRNGPLRRLGQDGEIDLRHVTPAASWDGGAVAAPASTVTLVVFDLGGVLIRHCRSWAEGAIAAGLPVRVMDESEDAVATRMQLGFALLCGLVTLDDFCEGLAASTGGAYSASEVRRVHASWMGEAYAGTEQLVERVLDAGAAEPAILSNMDHTHWRRLGSGPGALAAIARIPHRFASCEIGLAKPMPGIYAHVARGTGRRPEEILFLDDQPENLAAARAQGWAAELIDHREETGPQIERVLRRYEVI
jgi:FMN phosphatase YigB (HAD superfamily)